MKTVPRSGLLWVTKSKEIRSLKKEGDFSRGRTLLAWRSRETVEKAGIPIVGVIAGRGFNGSVPRNRAKRKARGILLENRGLLVPGYSYIIEARPGAENENYQNLVMEYKTVLSRLNG